MSTSCDQKYKQSCEQELWKNVVLKSTEQNLWTTVENKSFEQKLRKLLTKLVNQGCEHKL